MYKNLSFIILSLFFTGCICVDSVNNFKNSYISSLINENISEYQWGVLKNSTYKKEIKKDKIYFYINHHRYNDTLTTDDMCKYLLITNKDEIIIDYKIIENEENCLYSINCGGPY